MTDDLFRRPPTRREFLMLGTGIFLVASLPRAVQEENRGPTRLRRIVGGHVHLVAIGFTADGDAAIEEPRLHLLQ